MNLPFQAILFDFDGTLVQSNQIKRDLLFVVARTAGATDELFAQVFKDHPRADRFGLYRELLIQMKCRGNTEAKVAELCDLYGDLTTAAISKAPEIPGAEEFLKTHAADIPLYINSATPEDSLLNTVEERGWSDYFRGIYGRPKSKPDIIKLVQDEAGLLANQILFVGDSLQDLESAQDNGCLFLGVSHEPGWHYAFPDNVPVLRHYKDFFTLSANTKKVTHD